MWDRSDTGLVFCCFFFRSSHTRCLRDRYSHGYHVLSWLPGACHYTVSVRTVFSQSHFFVTGQDSKFDSQLLSVWQHIKLSKQISARYIVLQRLKATNQHLTMVRFHTREKLAVSLCEEMERRGRELGMRPRCPAIEVSILCCLTKTEFLSLMSGSTFIQALLHNACDHSVCVCVLYVCVCVLVRICIYSTHTNKGIDLLPQIR